MVAIFRQSAGYVLMSERAKMPEVQGVNEVGKSCFSEQIRRAAKRLRERKRQTDRCSFVHAFFRNRAKNVGVKKCSLSDQICCSRVAFSSVLLKIFYIN